MKEEVLASQNGITLKFTGEQLNSVRSGCLVNACSPRAPASAHPAGKPNAYCFSSFNVSHLICRRSGA
jgi:hypothetical protein